MCDALSRLKLLRNSGSPPPASPAMSAMSAAECHPDGIQSPEAKGGSLKSPAGLINQMPARAVGGGRGCLTGKTGSSLGPL